MKILRQLYDWVLHWADTPYGAPALFVLAFTESSFFPVPPDPLLMALALGRREKALAFAAVCTAASVLGALFGYAIGYWVWWAGPDTFSAVARFFFDHVPGFSVGTFRRIQDLFERWNFWIVFTAGFTPIPYKVFTVAGGAFAVNLPMFLLASVVSRGARFFLVAALIWRFGAPIRAFIDRYFDLLAVLFTVLLVGGFILVKWGLP
ncbi:MAG TPA: YqaA family protein [Syntrophales bacterium]|nr:YqaA family protein [Syntrophales bacterium]HOM08015.1 YqaA family protein [Syntrophales bacterium]HOO00695.1 YqaA family protein [Syntrophales bacterium]HPC01928.1 YqaA family protein [Syntrophales bacterium]HPQ07441.1 YqaA family protein [Syntrophales bacterium]